MIAIGVIVAGLVLVYSLGSKEASTVQTGFYSEDLMSLLSNTRIYEVNNPYVDGLETTGDVVNTDNTLVEQAGEFYYKKDNSIPCSEDCSEILSKFIQNVTEGAMPPTYKFEIRIDESAVYSTAPLNPETEAIYSSRRIISGIYDDTQLWSYPVQIEVWQ